MESATNEMTVENISRVFAPSLFPETPLDASNPMLAFAEVQLQKVILTHLITKCMCNEDSILASVKLSSKMMSRLQHSTVTMDEGEDKQDNEANNTNKEKDDDNATDQIRTADMNLSSQMISRLNRSHHADDDDDEEEEEDVDNNNVNKNETAN